MDKFDTTSLFPLFLMVLIIFYRPKRCLVFSEDTSYSVMSMVISVNPLKTRMKKMRSLLINLRPRIVRITKFSLGFVTPLFPLCGCSLVTLTWPNKFGIC